ncbi:hypothetical protein A9Q99_01635 [Gammaproteobacteria bacterium 45_16_T64]|nr:hypothetical protein A9Q99_01635 [Gammaproteobacteria bacterium 45_16_T64]
MQRLVGTALLIGSLGLTGCTSWPQLGRGGMAEHHREDITPVMADQPLGPEHGLRFDLELTSRHLDILVLEGAQLCFPASVLQAKRRQHRIERELIGDLAFDAANDLIIQRGLLARLERQLDYVRNEGLCTLTSQFSTESLNDDIEHLVDLLNSDNQFAFDSHELNPKYVVRLAKASLILNKYRHYQLKITGHSDAKGNENHNASLSIKRAQQVGRYLQILGINNSRLSFDAVGSKEPFFDGDEAHERLVNRRVTIEVVEATHYANEERNK